MLFSIWLALACAPHAPAPPPATAPRPDAVPGLDRLPPAWRSVDQQDGRDVLGCGTVTVDLAARTVAFDDREDGVARYDIKAIEALPSGFLLLVVGAGGVAEIEVRTMSATRGTAVWKRAGRVDVYASADHAGDFAALACP